MSPVTTLRSTGYAIPEIALALGALLVVAWALSVKGRARLPGVFGLALTALAVSGIADGFELRAAPRLPLPAVLFDGQLVCDGYACVFRLLFVVVSFLVIVAAPSTRELERGTEVVALVLVACLGMNLMAMAHALLPTYLAMEVVAIASVALTALCAGGGPGRAHEAALKQVVYGGVGSAVMLYGMSWLYGLTRSSAFPDIAEHALAMTRSAGHVPNALAIAAACVLVGLACKIAAVPFHMWAPDVCEGASPVVGAFLSIGPPIAGVALLVRVLREGFGVQSLSAEPLAGWSILVGSLAVASMTVGNLAALAQTSMKRLLAYCSIAQTGTMLLAVAVFDAEGASAMTFYAISSGAISLAAFLAVFAASEAAGGDESLAALRGFGARAPALGASLAVFFVSLVGLPPSAGFVAKLYVVTALLRAPGEYHAWYWLLACACVVNTALSLACCLRVLRAMYFESAAETARVPVVSPVARSVIAVALTIPTVLLGVWWTPLYDFVSERMASLP